MSLSDCEKCWNTPCTCGWELRYRSIDYLEKQKHIYERAIEFKKAHPEATFSTGNINTEDDLSFMAHIRK